MHNRVVQLRRFSFRLVNSCGRGESRVSPSQYTSETIDFTLSVVEFHRLYALPKEYLQSVASGTALRLRLLPPYREHLSQAFARYFMRVGLPIDIPKERVKDYR